MVPPLTQLAFGGYRGPWFLTVIGEERPRPSDESSGMRASVLKGASVLATGHVAGQLCSLVRNIIIARAIGPENFGLAATFVVTVSLLEMMSDLSLDKMLLQAKDGNDEHLQSCAQFLQAIRGIFMAVLLFAVARPIANVFDVPHAVWAYRTLAILPLIRGFAHLDVKRLQRELRFAPFAIVDFVPQLVGLGTAIVLIMWIQDYSVALWIILAQAVVMVGLSHLLAERTYSWTISRAVAGRFFHFGWPLVMNGLLLWVAMQSDRLVVGSLLSTEALGVYAAAANLLIMPTSLILKIGGQVGLPLLAQMQDNAVEFSHRFGVSTQYVLAVVVVCFATLMVLLPILIPFLYGDAFGSSETFLVLLVASFMIRAARAIPVLAALSLGETKTVAVGNLARVSGLPVIILGATAGGSLAWVAGCLLFVEGAAFAATWWRLSLVIKNRGIQMPSTSVLVAFCLVLSMLMLGTMAYPMSTWISALATAGVVALLFGCLALGMLPHVRSGLIELVGK